MKRYLIALFALPACTRHIITEKRMEPGVFTYIEGCSNCPFTMDFPGGTASTKWYNSPTSGTPVLLGQRLYLPKIRDTAFYVDNSDSVRSSIRLSAVGCCYMGVPEAVIKRYNPYGTTCLQPLRIKDRDQAAIRKLRRNADFKGATMELVDFDANSLFDGPLSVRTYNKIYTAKGKTPVCFLSITDRKRHVFMMAVKFTIPVEQ